MTTTSQDQQLVPMAASGWWGHVLAMASSVQVALAAVMCDFCGKVAVQGHGPMMLTSVCPFGWDAICYDRPWLLHVGTTCGGNRWFGY